MIKGDDRTGEQVKIISEVVKSRILEKAKLFDKIEVMVQWTNE